MENTSKKSKESKQKKKPKTKKTEITFKISDETLEIIKKYKVDNVFINQSKITDENILTSLIIHHKVLDYKCYHPKCKVAGEWCGSPIKLLLERINNKSSDLRLKNLRFVCYNCYFVNNSSNFDKLFVKMKKDAIIECKLCKYNLSNMGKKYQELKICKMCIKKNTDKTMSFQGKNLFLNTFDNNLTEEDINQKIKSTDNIDDLLQLTEELSSQRKTSYDNNKSKQNYKSGSNKNFINNNLNNTNFNKKNKKEKSTQLINIDIDDLNMDDMKIFSDMINNNDNNKNE